jgi:hypothetical protein
MWDVLGVYQLIAASIFNGVKIPNLASAAPAVVFIRTTLFVSLSI